MPSLRLFDEVGLLPQKTSASQTTDAPGVTLGRVEVRDEAI